jgi:hypothetical protein
VKVVTKLTNLGDKLAIEIKGLRADWIVEKSSLESSIGKPFEQINQADLTNFIASVMQEEVKLSNYVRGIPDSTASVALKTAWDKTNKYKFAIFLLGAGAYAIQNNLSLSQMIGIGILSLAGALAKYE